MLMALMFILTMILLNGCIKGDFHVTLNKDSSADLDYKLGMSSQLIALMSMDTKNKTDLIGEMKKNFESEGFTVTQYKDGDYQGVQAKKHVADAKDIKNVGVIQKDFANENKMNISTDKGLLFNTNHLVGNFDLSTMQADPSDPTGFQKMMVSQIDLKFTLTLPDKAEMQNASRVLDDGKTYQWDLFAGKNNDIKVDIKTLNILNLSLMVGFVILILIVIIVIWISKSKKQRALNEPQAIEMPTDM